MSHEHELFTKSKARRCAESGHGNHNRKCSVRVPKQSTIYCGEKLRDEIMGYRLEAQEKVCDCIVCMKDNAKISLVEMKSKVSGDFVGQFEGGLKMLRHMLDADTFALQAVLATSSPPFNSSEYSKLKRTLTGVNPPVGITRIKCSEEIPENYVSGCRLM